MKILYVCHRIPYPPNKGDKIRSFNEIKYLSKNHDLYLAFLVDDPADVKHVDALRDYCVELAWEQFSPRQNKIKAAPHMFIGRPLSLPYFYSPQIQHAIDAWATRHSFDAVICFSGPMAEYVFKCKALKGRSAASPMKRIMDFCDVDSDKWGQYAGEAKFPMNLVYGLEQKRLLAYEARVNRAFDHSVFVTENEAQLFRDLVPAARNLEVVGNGVDFDYFSPLHKGAACCAPTMENTDLVFTGAMDYHANVDAVMWFCREILPVIREAGIGADFCIVGGKPTAEVQALARIPGVQVTGFVEDIRPWYMRAAVSVIPLRLARGVQNKVLEAMAMGCPVVTTRKAAEGVGAKNGEHLLVADDPGAFAAAAIDLYRDPAARRQLGETGRAFVREHFDWRRNMEKLEQLL